MHLKQLWDLSRKSVRAWVDDYAPSMGAALAYYFYFVRLHFNFIPKAW